MNDNITAENVQNDVTEQNNVMQTLPPSRDELLRRRKKDGRRVKGISPFAGVIPFIMTTRNASSNYIRERVEVSRIDKYIKEKRNEGLVNFSLMHVIIATYVRSVAEYPALNRFIRGQRIWARNGIEIMLTIKKEMSINSPDTVIKAYLDASMTAEDIYREFDRIVAEYRASPGGDFDNTAKVLNYLPRILFKAAIATISWLDYHNILPAFLLRVSPFHGSMFITSMGSLGIPTIYHHLYDFGNVPVFISFGAKYHENVIEDDGTVGRRSYVDMTIVMDERICDGYYYAACLKCWRRYFRNPWKLDSPPDEVREDIK